MTALAGLTKRVGPSSPPGPSGRRWRWCLTGLGATALVLGAAPAQAAAEAPGGATAPAAVAAPAGEAAVLAPPPALFSQGVPPLPASLQARVQRYTDFRGHGFVDWHPLRREMLLAHRGAGQNLVQLWLARGPQQPLLQLTREAEPVSRGSFEPGAGRYLVYQRASGGDEAGQLWRLDLDEAGAPRPGASPVRLTDPQQRHHAAGWLRGRGELLVLSQPLDRSAEGGRREQVRSQLWATDPLQPGSRRLLADLPGGGWMAVSVAPDDRRLALTEYLGAGHSRVWQLDLRGGPPGVLQPLLPAPGDPKVADHLSGPFSPDGQSLWVLHNRVGEFMQAARLDLRSGALTPVPLDLPWDVTGIDASADGRRVALRYNIAGRSTLRLVDGQTDAALPGWPDDGDEPAPVPRAPPAAATASPPSTTGPATGPTTRPTTGPTTGPTTNPPHPRTGWALLRGASVGPPAFHPTRGELALGIHGAQAPGQVLSLGFGDQGRPQPPEAWTTPVAPPGVDPSRFVSQQVLRWTSFDGRPITGLISRPDPARFAGRRPVLVQIHGGPEGQATIGFLGRHNLLIEELGVALIQPNVRGSSGFGKTFLTLDDGRLREDAVKDIGALLDWIATQPDLDPRRVMVAGGSYGGYMALAVSTHFADRIVGAVDEVGISHFVTFLRHTESYRRDLRRVEYGDERDPAMADFLHRISPLTNAARIRKPLFVIQGRNDPRVPWTEAEQIVERVRANGTPVWYLRAENEGHGFQRRENIDHRQVVLLAFIEAFLLPGPDRRPEETPR